MIDEPIEVIQVHLKPGELVICRDARIVTTVLGSCVTLTMFNPRLGLAAICHAMLPEPHHPDALYDDHPDRYRYARFVIPAMADAFRRAGIRTDEIDAKLFGGANIMRSVDAAHSPPGVGQANIRMARLLLEREGLRLKASNVGGHGGRKIIFNTSTGGVLHKHLS